MDNRNTHTINQINSPENDQFFSPDNRNQIESPIDDEISSNKTLDRLFASADEDDLNEPDFIPGTQNPDNLVNLSKPTPKSQNKRKRLKFSPSVLPQRSRRPLFDDMNEKMEALMLVDPEKKSVIYEYLDRYSSDAVVRYFLELLFETKAIPILPNFEILKSWLDHECSITIPKNLAAELVEKFMDYFQTKYFKNNVDGAIENGKHLFNPKTNFNIPQFKYMPEKVLETMTKLKEEYATNLQKEASRGTLFTLQLIILRILQKIARFVKEEVNDETEIQKRIELTLATTYFIALTEFPKAKKVHVIDWTSYSSKTTHAVPGWRKTDSNLLPPEFPNRLASNAVEKINQQTLKLTGNAIKKEIDAFLANTSFPDQPQYRNGPRRGQQSNPYNNQQFRGNGQNRSRGQQQQRRGRYYYNNGRGQNHSHTSTPVTTTQLSGRPRRGGLRSQTQQQRSNRPSTSNHATSTPYLPTTMVPTSSKQVMESFT